MVLISNAGVTIVCLWFLWLTNKEIVRLHAELGAPTSNTKNNAKSCHNLQQICIRHTRTLQQQCFLGNKLCAHPPCVERPLSKERYKLYQLASGRAQSFHTSRGLQLTICKLPPPTHTHTHARHTHNSVSLGDAHVSEGSCYGGHSLFQFWIGDITCILTLT